MLRTGVGNIGQIGTGQRRKSAKKAQAEPFP
jgi:hypothetical protein